MQELDVPGDDLLGVLVVPQAMLEVFDLGFECGNARLGRLLWSTEQPADSSYSCTWAENEECMWGWWVKSKVCTGPGSVPHFLHAFR
jgi:hypothetical protein